MDVSSAWRTARNILGQNMNLAPTAIKATNEDGEFEMVTNPKKLANMFNNFVSRKIQLLRQYMSTTSNRSM